MPAPATASELLDLIQRSGVVEDGRLRGYVQSLAADGGPPADPQKLAGMLVRDGILTYFQAEQLLQGKYKRFSLGKYKVLEKLGAGGMAQVFLCEHKLMRRRVAIKVLPVAKADDRASLERFYREARAVAAVDHPNIVRAYDIDQDENLHFLVMEYVDGTNLQDLVKKFGPLGVVRACHYVYGAAVGLQHAHEMGLIHRDVKPGNILIDRAGVVKILDMGLARFFNDDEDVLTKKYDENVLGTADYLAPEQALDSHAVDIRADIYSLGATFYFLLTGSPLFPEGSVAQKLMWHQNRPPRPIRSLRPDVPDAVVAVVEKMLAKEPARRYQAPGEVMAALAGWVASPIPPPAEKEMPQVSPAAGGGRGPATMVGPGGYGRPGVASDAPTVVAAAGAGSTLPPTRPGVATGPPDAPPVGGHQAVWESLDTDTQPIAAGDAAHTPADPAPVARVRRPPVAGKAGRRPLVYAGLGLGVLAAAAGAYFAFFRTPPAPDTPPPPGHRITVTTGGGENTARTLREALARASPGDTIVVADPKLAETKLTLNPRQHKDVTVESATPDGRPAVIAFAGGGVVMLEATNVEGFRLRNLVFDGQPDARDARHRAEVGVQVSGSCPGAVIENVTVRNVRLAGFRVQNAAGGEGRPILLDRVRVYDIDPAGEAVLVTATGADTRRVVIRNSRFEGPAEAGVRVDGPATDLEIAGNRFYNLDAAVSFGRVAEGNVVKARVIGNTVCAAKAGVLFDMPPPRMGPPPGKFDLLLSQNYFALTKNVWERTTGADAIPGVTADDNARDPESGEGNVHLPAAQLAAPLLPTPNRDDDATFLRFPGGNPSIAPGRKVGAP